MQRLSLVALAAALCSCASVTTSPITSADFVQMKRGDVLTTGELGTASLEALSVLGLDPKHCEEDFRNCVFHIGSSDGLNNERRLATLAELWLHTALKRSAGRRPPGEDSALLAYLEVARYAYAYLFYSERAPDERALEERQTQVRDYYNFAVQQAVTGLFSRSMDARTHRAAEDPLDLPGWTIDVDTARAHLDIPPDGISELLPASSLQFDGLRSTYRRDGFGAELVAVLDRSRMPQNVDFSSMFTPSLTTLLRFDGEALDDILSTQRVRLEAYDPYRYDQLSLRQYTVPLAGNFTAGYGLWLTRSKFARQSLRVLFGRDTSPPHLYLMQPYDPNRRIVLMLHGLASSPEAWVNVANEVLGDESLRRQYQIWQIYYPTNIPLAYNRLSIHDAIAETLQHFDPDGSHPASHEMVIVGHSMGGILARLMVSSTGQGLTSAILKDKGLNANQRRRLKSRLEPLLDFEPMDNITRAIFIAAPHRGSPLADYTLARWVANLIRLPTTVLSTVNDLVSVAAEGGTLQLSGTKNLIPNSIDNLSPHDEYIQATAKLPISPTVTYHSIIGRKDPMLALQNSSDGVVPYRSARLNGAASELIVKSGHGVQETPEAILEVRRILKLQTQGDSAQAYAAPPPVPALFMRPAESATYGATVPPHPKAIGPRR